MKPPDLSIITPWLEHAELIADYERSVRAPGVEVIIIDNGSSESSAAQILAMVQRLGGIYLRNPTNHWFARANNQGLVVARGRLVMFLNNDIRAEAGWLTKVMLDVTAGALVGPTMLEVEVEGRRCRFLEGWCIAAHRDVWDRLGGWDADSFSMPYYEDTDLCVRAGRMGIGMQLARWPIAHIGQATSGTVAGAFKALEQNRSTFADRLYQRPAARPAALSALSEPAASALIDRGLLPEAEQMLNGLLKVEPGNVECWYLYCQVLRLSGRNEAAVIWLKHAIDIRASDEPQAWNDLAILLAGLGRHAEASEAFRRVILLMPYTAGSHLNLSKSLLAEGRTDQAVESARKAVALEPANAMAHASLSQGLTAANDFQEAVTVAQTAVRLNPNSTVALMSLGRALRGTERFADALAAFERVLSLAPDHLAAQTHRRELAWITA